MRRLACAGLALLAALWLSSSALAVSTSDGVRAERALLVGMDDFVTKASTYPSSTNNVFAMQETFQSAKTPLETLYIPSSPVTDAQQLRRLIRWVFRDADEDDVSYLYISTHGVYDPESGEEPKLLLSDGQTEGAITPTELQAAFEGILGKKVLILDACNSGAFIGKGVDKPMGESWFCGDDFKVLTSSGAMEESWYWSADDTQEPELRGREPQGAFYFTQALVQSLSPAYGYPADSNRDGDVTLGELYDYLLSNHGASTPQVYPQSDDFVVFRYDTEEPSPTGLDRSPIMDVTFSGDTLSREQSEIAIEFIAMRPVRVAYQIVYQREGKWQFGTAQLIYDAAERFAAYGDRPGAISAGRKVRSLRMDELAQDAYGYILVQLVSIDNGKLTVHAGQVVCVPPESGDVSLTAETQASFDPSGGKELLIFVGHDFPCELSVSVVDEQGATVRRICHRSGTRPMQMAREGSVFYWDGKLKSGELAPAGRYRVQAQATVNGGKQTVLSEVFVMQ